MSGAVTPRPRARRSVGLLVGLLVLTGCAGLPETGPVVVEEVEQRVAEDAAVDFAPGRPEPGAPPVEVVRGFLVAMQASPLNTSVARSYLSVEGRQRWVPERGTRVYDRETRTAVGADVRLDLIETVSLDGRGRWLGPTGDRSTRLPMVKEDGEWRIDRAPDRLLIPATQFETRFAQHDLYYLDKSAEVLVPEPVHVPTGAQASTFLVAALLRGPGRPLLGVERTFLPAGTHLDDLSVPVGLDGTVEVPLSDEVLDANPERLYLAFAQLAWTLRQVPGVMRMRVTVDGSPLQLPGEGSEVSVTGFAELDPAVAWASQALFGLRDGRLVTQVGPEELRVSGPFGSLDLGPRTLGLDLAGERVAVTTEDGRVLVAPRSRRSGTAPGPADASTVLAGGSDLLPPVWDVSGRLWVLDRTSLGADLHVVEAGIARSVVAPGITGENVGTLLVSRDGTRLVAEVTRRGRDRIVLARVERDATGSVRGVRPARPVPLGVVGSPRVSDLAWRSPGTLAVLVAPTPASSQVVVVRIDGSSSASDALTAAEVYPGAATAVVTAPAPGAPLLILTETGRLVALAPTARWVGSGIADGLRAPTFVG